MNNEIKFYSTRGEYGCFSNFSRHSIELKGKTWLTSEHYFQAMKFEGTKYETKIRKAKGPKKAAEIGRDRSLPLRSNWENIKENFMFEALYAKFTQHKDLKEILINTGDKVLIEHTERDSYWGDGGNGSGENRLGHLLMRLRRQLIEEEKDKQLKRK